MRATNWHTYFKLPNPGLRAFYGRVRSGQDEVYTTPFFGDHSMRYILSGWDKIIQNDPDISRMPSLLKFENDLREKVGPMSVMLPLRKRMSDIDSYYESVLLDSTPLSNTAISSVIEEFSQMRGLRPRDQRRTLEAMKKSTNSGNPYFTKRRLVMDKTVPFDILQDMVQALPEGNWNTCAILGWRGQEGGPEVDDVKQRVVWMFPFAVNIAELSVYQPLIEASQSLNLVPAWVSMEAVDKRVTQLFDTKGPNDEIVCTDFKAFDQHFNPDMQAAAKAVLSTLLGGGNSEDWLERIFPIKYGIPLAYDWEKIRYGSHGMASGSGGTNADETLTHRALQYEAAEMAKSTLNLNSQCLGDDGMLSYPGIDVEQVMECYTRHGQEMNLTKQEHSRDYCTYLRRHHVSDYRINDVCVGIYSTYRALGRMKMQERFYSPDIWSSEMVELRWLSILENVKYHPLREKFVDYCMKGDKYHLGLDLPGFMDKIEKYAHEATSLMPDFLGYTRSQQRDKNSTSTGIADWWIVKYLKSK